MLSTKDEQSINKISINNYNQNEQIFELNFLSKYWAEVLQNRDWSMIQKLGVGSCGINDETLKVTTNLYWPQLQTLKLGSNQITSRGMELILTMNFKKLKKLEISKNKIGNSGAKILTKFDMPNLQELSIFQCEIESQGIKHLSKANWPKIHTLQLAFFLNQSNKMQLSGLELVNLHHWKSLKFLNVREEESFAWINSVLMETQNLKIYQYGIEINNQQLCRTIQQILRKRNLLNNQ